MFGVRGVLVGLGFFGVVYCLLSLLVACAWRCVNLLFRSSDAGSARLLFALRIFPLLGSVFITLAFALPAFLRLESGAIDEDLGTLGFSICTVLLLAASLFRVISAQVSTSRVIEEWLDGSRAMDTRAAAPRLQAKPGLPPLLLYGISAPEVLISESAVALLRPDELQAAVRHEIGHMGSRDNLKKLILHGAWFPGMASLDRAWQEAAEFAADEAAVSSNDDAIALAAALIKLSDLAPLQAPPAFTTGLVNLSALVEPRVQRLLAWNETRTRAIPLGWWCMLSPVLAAALYAVADYGQVLLLTHRFTEWFIH